MFTECSYSYEKLLSTGAGQKAELKRIYNYFKMRSKKKKKLNVPLKNVNK